MYIIFVYVCVASNERFMDENLMKFPDCWLYTRLKISYLNLYVIYGFWFYIPLTHQPYRWWYQILPLTIVISPSFRVVKTHEITSPATDSTPGMTVGAFHHFMSLSCVWAMARVSRDFNHGKTMVRQRESQGKPKGKAKLRKIPGTSWAIDACWGRKLILVHILRSALTASEAFEAFLQALWLLVGLSASAVSATKTYVVHGTHD